ncbi:MAG: PAS domain S-box protein [Rhodoferax sp.]|nr:PAS domain S-box protein [Rhodoferax sp.]
MRDDFRVGFVGAADYIVKPFRAPIVLARVRTHLALFDQTRELEHQVLVRTAALRQNEARLQLAASVFTHAKEGIFIIDQDSRVVDVNEAFTHITGYSREDAMGQDLRTLVYSERQSDDFYERRRQLILENGNWTGEVWNRRKNGDIHPEQLTLSVLYDAQGAVRNLIGLFTDLSEAKTHQSQLERLAHYDKAR